MTPTPLPIASPSPTVEIITSGLEQTSAFPPTATFLLGLLIGLALAITATLYLRFKVPGWQRKAEEIEAFELVDTKKPDEPAKKE